MMGNLKVVNMTGKYGASSLDLNIKIKNGKFHFGLFDKRD